MSARESAILELQASGSYADPAKLAARMQFWDAGYKYESRCPGVQMLPDEVTSCECAKAGTWIAPVCTHTSGIKCFVKASTFAKFTDEDKEEKGLGDCATNWDWPDAGITGFAPPLVGAAIVNDNNHLIILGLAVLLLLSQLR